MLSKLKNYLETTDEKKAPASTYQSSKKIDLIISKYAQLIKNFNLGPDNDIFDTWNFIRDLFVFEKIDWIKTNIRPSKNQFINSDTINQYCPQVDLMLFYLTKHLEIILSSGGEKMNKINIANLYIELINYIFESYNRDQIERIHDVKRFEYILDGSPFMIDLLRKGRGLVYRELEEEIGEETSVMGEIEVPSTKETEEEMEENVEAAEALDVETQYYEDETEDYAENTESEE